MSYALTNANKIYLILLNGGTDMESIESKKQFNDLWLNDLPAKFPKSKCMKEFSLRLGINERNARLRLITNNGLLAKDLTFLYNRFGIGFNYDSGFFLDDRKFDEIQAAEEREEAAALGLIL